MKEPNLIMKFFSFLLKVVVVVILMVVIAVASFEGVTYYLTGSLYDLRKMVVKKNDIGSTGKEEEEIPEIDDTNMRSTLFFVDSARNGKEYIALNMLNTQNYVLDILLIPANAQVTVGKDVLRDIQKEMPDAKNTVNISDISRSFGEEKYQMISDIMENVMGVTISGYDVMTEENFMDFLGMVDSVEYQLDNNISYRDEKGNLKQLSAGETALDSEQAMALMTYMDGSETQESARLERTSTYLQTFFQQLFEENKASVIYKKYTNLVESSSNQNQSEKEKSFEELNPDEITIRILQGSESNNVFTVDSQKVQLQISALAKQAETAGKSSSDAKENVKENTTEKKDTVTAEDSKEYSIELYNAAYVSGLAGEWETYLEGEGYNISLVDSYQEEGPLSTTRIVVTEDGMGEDLLKYFPDASIEVDEIDTGGDIQIFIGTDSTDVGGSGETGTEDIEEDTEDASEEDMQEDTSEEKKETGGSGGSYSFDTDSE